MADMIKGLNGLFAKYSEGINTLADVGKTLVIVSEVILAVQLALADGQLTPGEIRDLSAKLAKLQPMLKAAQAKIGK